MLDGVNARIAGYLARALSRDEGQTLVEYALILVLISLASLVGLGLLSDAIQGVLQRAQTSL